jgi:hypothetical protein
VVGVRLELEPGGARSDCPGSACLEVVDEEVEVHLHGYDGTGPHRWAEVLDLLERDGAVRPVTVAQCSLARASASGAFTVVTLSLIWSDITGSPLPGTPG